mgnify:FL=1|tara:strand:- start:224 stop:532 length:309 start_codon:yes stop_codon:yes gene_type:complete
MAEEQSEGISIDQVRHLATLARIKFSSEEIEKMQQELNSILDPIKMLQDVDTQGVPPTSHSGGVISVMREDQVHSSYPTKDMIANAPLTEGNYVKIKEVLEQ